MHRDAAVYGWHFILLPIIFYLFPPPSLFTKGLAVGLGIGALAEVAKKSLRPEERNGEYFFAY